MSIPRFYHHPLPTSGPVELSDAEARHASNVLRLQVGASVILFDGQGGEARANISSVSKRSVQAEILERTDFDRELSCPLELLVALPKGERQKTLIDGLVQFGTTQLVPLECQRGVAQPTEGALERLRRSVIESCKQCGRNQLLRIVAPQPIESLIASSANPHSHLSLVAHPDGASLSLPEMMSAANAPGITGARVAIGPEGGFTDAEVARLIEAGWTPVTLGPRLLRIEYAALQVAAWWAALKS